MAQDQAVDEALSRLVNVAASIFDFQKRSDIDETPWLER